VCSEYIILVLLNNMVFKKKLINEFFAKVFGTISKFVKTIVVLITIKTTFVQFTQLFTWVNYSGLDVLPDCTGISYVVLSNS